MIEWHVTNPISANDIEIEIAYATTTKGSQRKDADNINKPTLDALEGVAYLNDKQVGSVSSTIFDKDVPLKVGGCVEYLGRLFYSAKPHVLLIMIYSDARVSDLGGELEVQRRRYLDWQRNIDQLLACAKQTSS